MSRLEHGIRYVRPVAPLRFPASDPGWEMSESVRHARMCELLYSILRRALPGEAACVGADQFVYFDATNPRRRCAPDVFVRLGVPSWQFRSWKTWKHGAPHLGVEILSPSDTKEKLTLPQKLERYRLIGVREVVAFDVDAAPGKRIRAWDSISGDFVERVVEGERTPCLTLRAFSESFADAELVIGSYEHEGLTAQDRLVTALRVACRGEMLPDRFEGERMQARAEAERARAEAERARAEAERARVAEVELAEAKANHAKLLAEIEALRGERDRRG